MAKNKNARRQEANQAPSTKTDAEVAAENEQNTDLSQTKKVMDPRYDADGNKKFAPPYKYETHGARAKEKQIEFDPNWAKRDVEFLPGHKPKGNGTSVMYKIWAIADANRYPEGHELAGQHKPILGSELAVMVRNAEYTSNRSKYTTTGIPEVGWAEDYINGACRKNFGYLVMVDASKVKRVAPNAGKETSPDAGDNKPEQGDGKTEGNGSGTESVTINPGETGTLSVGTDGSVTIASESNAE